MGLGSTTNWLRMCVVARKDPSSSCLNNIPLTPVTPCGAFQTTQVPLPRRAGPKCRHMRSQAPQCPHLACRIEALPNSGNLYQGQLEEVARAQLTLLLQGLRCRLSPRLCAHRDQQP